MSPTNAARPGVILGTSLDRLARLSAGAPRGSKITILTLPKFRNAASMRFRSEMSLEKAMAYSSFSDSYHEGYVDSSYVQTDSYYYNYKYPSPELWSL
jgi:hypothetical protein